MISKKAKLSQLEEKINYSFSSKEFLKICSIHKSYYEKNNN